MKSPSDKNHDGEDWIVFRLDSQIKDQPVDIYLILDIASDELLAFQVVYDELSQQQADEFVSEALRTGDAIPAKLLLTAGDPAELVLRKSVESVGIKLEAVAASEIEKFVAPYKLYFGKNFYSPSSLAYTEDGSVREELKQIIPDSYDLCPCASGLKYKFCCKKIFREITDAMMSVEAGDIDDALESIAQAKQVAGETAEVLCREAVVYSYFDEQKSVELLNKCLAVNPNHPRAHYLCGLVLKKRGNYQKAIDAYEKAIDNYPPSDHYQLNEVYNNLGVVFHAIGDLDQAKLAWEKAVLYMPNDEIARRNLGSFIYNRADLYYKYGY